MLHAGLDSSRRRLDYCLLDEQGNRVEVGATPPDEDGLRGFVQRVELRDGPMAVRAAIESMNGARLCMTRWSAAVGTSRSPTRRRSRVWGRWRARPIASTRGCSPSLEFPEPWRGGVLAAVAMIDDLDAQIAGIDRELKAL